MVAFRIPRDLPFPRLIALAALVLGLLLLALTVAAFASRAGPAAAATPVYADGAGTCNSLTPCFTTIQEAVNNAGPAPAEVNVFPGTYNESVSVDDMGIAIAGAPGTITLRTVNASGAPAPGTATVIGTTSEAFQTPLGNYPGNVTIDGFVVAASLGDAISVEVDGDVTIANVTADGSIATSGHGIDVFSSSGITVTNSSAHDQVADGFRMDTGGSVAITNSTANDNGDNGFQVDATGSITVTGSTANGNDDEGFDLNASGDLTVSNSVANGTVDDDGLEGDGANTTITNFTANNNFDEGIEVAASGNLLVDRVTTIGNGDDGIDVEAVFTEVSSVANVTVRNSNTQNNGADGIEFLEFGDVLTGAGLVDGNIICGNGSGIELNTDVTIDAEGNWWGAATGPTHPNNPAGTGDEVLDSANLASGTVDFDPFVNTVSGTAAAATVGQSSSVSFQFSGGSGTVFLGQGPGNPNEAPPFSLTTNNGTLTSSTGTAATVTESINQPNGTLSVTLKPSATGAAAVTVTGPCGLTGTANLNAAAAPVAATPTPAALPPTGSAPSAPRDAALAFLLAGAALAAAAGLVVVKRSRS